MLNKDIILEGSLLVYLCLYPITKALSFLSKIFPTDLLGGKHHGFEETNNSIVQFLISIHFNFYRTNVLK